LKIQRTQWNLWKRKKPGSGFTRRRSGGRVPARPPFVSKTYVPGHFNTADLWYTDRLLFLWISLSVPKVMLRSGTSSGVWRLCVKVHYRNGGYPGMNRRLVTMRPDRLCPSGASLARQKSGLDRNGGPQVDHFRWADDAGCDDRADFVLRDYSDSIIVSVGSDRGTTQRPSASLIGAPTTAPTARQLRGCIVRVAPSNSVSTTGLELRLSTATVVLEVPGVASPQAAGSFFEMVVGPLGR
jgi:hypothetical protein